MKIYLFKSQKDLYINFEKDTNMIIVTGISGSGKSRTSLALQKKYNYELLSFDFIFDWEFERKPSSFEKEILKEFKKKYPEFRNSKNNTKSKIEVCNCFYDFIADYILSKNIKIIIDGAYFLNEINFEKIKNERIILKRTSIIKSIIQRTNRNKKHIIAQNYSLFKTYRRIFGMYGESIKKSIIWKKLINNFIEKIQINEGNKINILEREESIIFD